MRSRRAKEVLHPSSHLGMPTFPQLPDLSSNCDRPLLRPELVVCRYFMPNEVFRRCPLDDPFFTLLAAEMRDEAGNFLLLVDSLI